MGQIDPVISPSPLRPDPDTGDREVAALLAQVGARVRQARERKGLPRRVLSEMSGVSMRYLAQLEGGEGNISIGLLQRLATALEYRIEWLVGRDGPDRPEAARVAALYAAAGDETRARIDGLLDAGARSTRKANRICLIGLRGAGKSTLGAMAGRALGAPFAELNVEIEMIAGMPISEIMALYGHEGYRKLEAEALNRIAASHDRIILAVAGGIVAESETYARLLDAFHTVWIQASATEHMARVRAQGDERPMAGNPEAMAQLRSILDSREALYERADARIDTSGATAEASLRDLLTLIEQRRFLA